MTSAPCSNGLAGLLFRQRTGGGIVDIRDVAVGHNFTDVVTNVAASSPVLIATNYNVVSNYAGNPALLEVFATSIGGGALSYQWYQITTGGATNRGRRQQPDVLCAQPGRSGQTLDITSAP